MLYLFKYTAGGRQDPAIKLDAPAKALASGDGAALASLAMAADRRMVKARHCMSAEPVRHSAGRAREQRLITRFRRARHAI